MLSALPLPQINTGTILLVSLAGIRFHRVAGVAIHTALISYAIVIDQTRLQPEIVSLVILMWGSLACGGLATIARAHLISLWFYAGLNKLLSTGYRESFQFVSHPRSSTRALLIPLTEIAIAVFICIRKTRKPAVLFAFVLHLLILAALVFKQSNSAVWPWNLALAFAAFAFFYTWRESAAESLRRSNRWVIIVSLLILISPLGFYVGVVDAYLAHNLYSKNTPVGVWHHADGKFEGIQTWQAFNVPFPPEPRLYEQYFNQVCGPGDYLVISDSRYWAAWRGTSERVLTCPRAR